MNVSIEGRKEMNFELDEQQLAVRVMVQDFAAREITPIIQEFYEKKEFPWEIWKKMAKLGLMGIPFPEKYGGSEGGILSYVIAVEEISRADRGLGLAYFDSVTMGGYPIAHFGTEEQKVKWLVSLAQGEFIGGMGLTEPEGGSDASMIKSTATLDGDEWVLNGTKSWCTNSGIGNFINVITRTGIRAEGRAETSMFIVPTNTLGYSTKPEKKICAPTSDTSEVTLVDCRVPADNLLGERGAGIRQALTLLDEGRVVTGAAALGLAQNCLDLALSYAKERVQFGKPIISHQLIGGKLADMVVAIEAARLLIYKAAFLEEKGKQFDIPATIAKLFASEAAVWIASEAVQIFGAYGLSEDFPISRCYKDAKLMTIGEGTSEIQRMVIDRWLSKTYSVQS